MTPFAAAVRDVVASLGPGEVMSYGEVAARAGRPGAARGVVAVLKAHDDLPWWRVVNARGRVHPGAVAEASARLRAEGVVVVGGVVVGAGVR